MKQENDCSSSEEIRVNNGEATFIARHGLLYYNYFYMKKTEEFFISLAFFTREEINCFHKLAKEILGPSYFHGRNGKKGKKKLGLNLPSHCL